MDIPSLITLNRIIPTKAVVREYFSNLGSNSITRSSLTSCSRLFDMVYGHMRSLPKKYPLNISDMVMNGRVIPIAMMGYVRREFFNRFVARYLDDIINISIRDMLNSIIRGIIDRTNFLLLFFFSLTSLDTAMGRPRFAIVINRPKVGSTSMYSPNPVGPMFLVRYILITMAIILLIRPPRIRIRVDFINLFFIMGSPS